MAAEVVHGFRDIGHFIRLEEDQERNGWSISEKTVLFWAYLWHADRLARETVELGNLLCATWAVSA